MAPASLVACPSHRPRAAPLAAAPPQPQGRTALVEGLQGLPIVKPPYGVMAAIDLSNGPKLMFQVPHGETPDAVRNNPLLRGLNIRKTGQTASVGVMVTKTMVVAGDPQVTSPPGRPRGAMLRAYDKQTGAEVGEVLDAGADQRFADDLHDERPPVHHRGRERWQLHGRIHRLRAAPSEIRSGN